MIKSFIDFMKDKAEAEDESSKETETQDTEGGPIDSVSDDGVPVQDDGGDADSSSTGDGEDSDDGTEGHQE